MYIYVLPPRVPSSKLYSQASPPRHEMHTARPAGFLRCRSTRLQRNNSGGRTDLRGPWDRTSVTWTSQNPERKFQGGFFENASFEELPYPITNKDNRQSPWKSMVWKMKTNGLEDGRFSGAFWLVSGRVSCSGIFKTTVRWWWWRV